MRFIALFFIFLLQIAWAEEPWKIAIIGDTHDAPPRMEGSEGVAVNFIKTLYGEILKHQVDMVIQVGDMADVQGSAPVKGLAKRKELNKMLEEKGIPFYALRGNHEAIPGRAVQFRELFMPTRKQGAKGLATRKLNYGIRHKNASLYFMDIDLTPAQLVDFSAWIKRNRSKANSVPRHCLVFTHRTLQTPMQFRECLWGRYNDSATEQQNIFYRNLREAGVRFVVTGHLHAHDLYTITSPDRKHRLTSLICSPRREQGAASAAAAAHKIPGQDPPVPFRHHGLLHPDHPSGLHDAGHLRRPQQRHHGQGPAKRRIQETPFLPDPDGLKERTFLPCSPERKLDALELSG